MIAPTLRLGAARAGEKSRVCQTIAFCRFQPWTSLKHFRKHASFSKWHFAPHTVDDIGMLLPQGHARPVPACMRALCFYILYVMVKLLPNFLTDACHSSRSHTWLFHACIFIHVTRCRYMSAKASKKSNCMCTCMRAVRVVSQSGQSGPGQSLAHVPHSDMLDRPVRSFVPCILQIMFKWLEGYAQQTKCAARQHRGRTLSTHACIAQWSCQKECHAQCTHQYREIRRCLPRRLDYYSDVPISP